IENVPSFCHARNVEVQVPGIGLVVGDVAWSGNWFFITHNTPIPVTASNAKELTRVTQAIQDAINAAGITGANGEPIDHIEISAPPTRADADCRNFVLCSGGEYDRSPCGTGTSAKLAVLYAKGEISLGTRWRQESITGSLFTGWLTTNDRGELIPHIRGTAYVGMSVLVLDASFAGSGTTAAGMGHLVVMDDSPAQLALTAYSERLWTALAPELPHDVEHVACGTLWVAEDEAQLDAVRAKQSVYADSGVATEILSPAQLAEAEPHLRPGLAGALLVRGDAVIYPPNGARALLQRAVANGV